MNWWWFHWHLHLVESFPGGKKKRHQLVTNYLFIKLTTEYVIMFTVVLEKRLKRWSNNISTFGPCELLWKKGFDSRTIFKSLRALLLTDGRPPAGSHVQERNVWGGLLEFLWPRGTRNNDEDVTDKAGAASRPTKKQERICHIGHNDLRSSGARFCKK